MLREKCNRPMLLIERQKAMLLEVFKCIHELGPRYRHGMCFLKKVELMIIGAPQYYTKCRNIIQILMAKKCLCMKVLSYGIQ